MPYTVSNAPANVQKMSATKKRQWVAIWNSAYARAKKAGKSDKEAEASAFKQANGVTMKQAADVLALVTADIDALKEMGESAPSIHIDLPPNDAGADSISSSSIVERVISGIRSAFAGYDDYGGYPATVSDYTPEISDSYEAKKLPKAHDSVNYRAATQLGVTCADCISFCALTCNLVEGAIDPKGVCNLYRSDDGMETDQMQGSEHDEHELLTLVSMREEGVSATRLFVELAEATSDDGWMRILPKPGTYTHSKYGKITVTKARNQRFVDNVVAKVYDQQLPIDAEHAYKLSGAFGWIKPEHVRLNDDGSVSVKPEWTDRGHAALKEGRFKYISPEWWDEYVQPMTDKMFKDVLIGAALTTRPFFKEGSLDPIIYKAASEGGVFESPSRDGNESATSDGSEHSKEGERNVPDPKKDDVQTPAAFSEEERTSLLEKIAALEAKEADSKKFAEAKDEESKKLTERVAKMESDARHKRFSDMVMGRGDQGDGAPWVGGTDTHLSLLEQMAAQFGEDSDTFKQYVEMQRKNAATIKQSAVFTEFGRTGTYQSETSAAAEIDKAAKVFTDADPKMTLEQARVRVLEGNPALYERYERERTSR